MKKNNCDCEPAKPRRKFCCNDLVYAKSYGHYLLCEDEEEDGYVKLTLSGGLVCKASELTLLLPAEEIEKLTEWKGGAK